MGGWDQVVWRATRFWTYKIALQPQRGGRGIGRQTPAAKSLYRSIFSTFRIWYLYSYLAHGYSILRKTDFKNKLAVDLVNTRLSKEIRWKCDEYKFGRSVYLLVMHMTDWPTSRYFLSIFFLNLLKAGPGPVWNSAGWPAAFSTLRRTDMLLRTVLH